MYSFTADTIYEAYINLKNLDAKVGGLFSILSCLDENIIENQSYRINGEELRKTLSFVFDKEQKKEFPNSQDNYIIFAKNWEKTFFENEIKTKIDLLSCSVFFLRRNLFDSEKTIEEIENIFIKKFNLIKYINNWFIKNKTLKIEYNQKPSEENQKEFYGKISREDFKSMTFNSILQKNAYDLSAAGHIQTLYSGKGIQKCCLLSNESLESYYLMRNSNFQIEKDSVSDSSYIQNSSQIIYYGVPGSGKSHKIDHKFQQDYPDSKERENHTVRVVFHPEYTNADFVGQIMPSINQNGNVEYKFIPGPFAQILRRAYLNPAEKYCLVIEEINRGNAAAIFGDIFQLLDRFNKDEFDSENKIYSEGWSKYFVTNDFVNWYIRQNVIENPDQVTENGVAKIDEKEPKSINIGNLHFSANTGIRLPPNLSIFATMNTSDQNVFALDNAFQRRWDMELVENKFSDNDDEQKNAVIEVLNQKITWGDFQQTINSFIGEKSNESNLSSMEDKRLGCWFVKAKDGKIDTDNFKNKVLKYLWDDAFKFSRQEVFPEIKTFEQLQQKFKEIGFKVFSEDSGIKELIPPENNSETENSVDNIPHEQTEGNQE